MTMGDLSHFVGHTMFSGFPTNGHPMCIGPVDQPIRVSLGTSVYTMISEPRPPQKKTTTTTCIAHPSYDKTSYIESSTLAARMKRVLSPQELFDTLEDYSSHLIKSSWQALSSRLARLGVQARSASEWP